MQNCKIDTPVNNLNELDSETLGFVSGGNAILIDPNGRDGANSDTGSGLDPLG